MAQGNLSSALSSYQGSLAIGQRLAKSAPGNAEWQRDLSVSYGKVGDVQKAQGDLSTALSSYQGSLAIMQRLAKSYPGNAGWQRDLSVSYDRVGGVQRVQGDLESAVGSYRYRLAISQALVAKHGSKPQYISDIGEVAYRFVLARGFDKALEAADQAISLAPDKIWLQTNRAHALMFLGHTDEARSLYLRYRGERNVTGNKTWDALIIEDFAELRAVGLSNPLMKEIENQFVK